MQFIVLCAKMSGEGKHLYQERGEGRRSFCHHTIPRQSYIHTHTHTHTDTQWDGFHQTPSTLTIGIYRSQLSLASILSYLLLRSGQSMWSNGNVFKHLLHPNSKQCVVLHLTSYLLETPISNDFINSTYKSWVQVRKMFHLSHLPITFANCLSHLLYKRGQRWHIKIKYYHLIILNLATHLTSDNILHN